MLDDLDIVKMTMTIKDKTVEFIVFDYLRIYEDQYKAQVWRLLIIRTTETEDFKASMWRRFNIQRLHSSMKKNYAYDYTPTEIIDPDNHTISRNSNIPTKLLSGPNNNPMEAITYQYSVDGKQMTYQLEGKR